MTRPCAIALFLLLAAPAWAGGAAEYRRVQASTHVHVFEAAEAGAAESQANIVAVIGREAIMVVDTGLSPEGARRALADLRKVSRLPVRYVVNTHYRNDQLLGNAVFKEAFPDAVFLAHGHAIEQAARFHATIPRSGTRLARYVRPDYEVDGEVRLQLGELLVAVRHLGPANSPGDLIVWVEADKLAATGELLVAPVGDVDHGKLQRWAQTLARLRALDPRVIVPARGAVISEEDQPGTSGNTVLGSL
jgi:cyclase